MVEVIGDDYSRWKDKTVLVVDDSKIVQEDLSNIYRSMGMRVVGTASDGLEAIEICKQNEPFLVSLDIIMPVMHGIDCYRELTKLYPKLKVVFVSFLAQKQGALNPLFAEIPEIVFISKPASASSIHRALDFLSKPAVTAVAAPPPPPKDSLAESG